MASSHPIPKILHVNSESRAFAQTRYTTHGCDQLLTQYMLRLPGSIGPSRHYFFNAELDLFALESEQFDIEFIAVRRGPMGPSPKHLFLPSPWILFCEMLNGLELEDSARLWNLNFPRLQSVTVVPQMQKKEIQDRLQKGDVRVGYRKARDDEITPDDGVSRWKQTFGNENPQISKSYSGLGKIELNFIVPVFQGDEDQTLAYCLDA